MFYWVIPYLVAYNLTEPAADWKNGPVHIFEAEVNMKFVSDSEANLHSNAMMLFGCKPINTSFIECQVQNATLENHEISDNNTTSLESEDSDWYEDFGPVVFHIEFDKMGIKNLTFPEPQGYFREMAIRLIFDNLNVGIDLTDKNFDHYNAIDKTVYGDCPTNFLIKKLAKRVENQVFSLDKNVAVRKLMIVPLFDKFSDDQTILIEKERKMTKCLNKKGYSFGSSEPSALDRKKGFVSESNTINSRSEIYLGTNGFNSFSEHSGTFKVGIKSENSKHHSNRMIVGKTSEKIRLTLISIIPGTT